MGATIRTLLDENDDFIYPKTKTVAVYDENDNTLDNVIEDISDDVAELETNLGDPSSASSVTGADAFSKISTLNSDLADLTASVEVTANGTETYGQLLARLWAAIDKTKISAKSALRIVGLQAVYQMTNIISNGIIMGNASMNNSLPAVGCVTMLNNTTYIAAYSSNTATDYTATTASGKAIFYY